MQILPIIKMTRNSWGEPSIPSCTHFFWYHRVTGAAWTTTTPDPTPATTNAVATSPTVFLTSAPTWICSSINVFNSALWFSTANRLERPVTTTSLYPEEERAMSVASWIAPCKGIGVRRYLNSTWGLEDNAEFDDFVFDADGGAYRAQATLSAVSDWILISVFCCP